MAGARGRARRARARPPGREEDDTGRWRWWARPGLSHSAGPGGLRGERQVVLLLFPLLIVFYFVLFCFCLVKILTHFIKS